MTPRTTIIVVAALGLALGVAVAAAKVEQDPSKPPPEAWSPQPVPVHQAPLRAQCWQKGIKIVDEEALEGLSIAAATRRSTVTFKRGEDQTASVFLLPLGEALCLLRPEH